MRYQFEPTNDTTVDIELSESYIIGTRRHWKYSVSVNGEVLFQSKWNLSTYIGKSEKTALRDLIGFLTLQPGDTDDDYFDKYNEKQMVWANSYACEVLSIEADE